MSKAQAATAVLISGGLDSAVLLAEEAARGVVQPIYVRAGLSWEESERLALDRLLAQAVFRGVRGLVTLTVDMRDVYAATHWAVEGRPPGYDTPDEDVYLPGRNVVLLGKAAVYCAAAGLGRIVLGTLGHNPFPDATPEFRAAMARALSIGLAHELLVEAPYAALDKADIVGRGVRLGVPLESTLSCMSPRRLPRAEGAARPGPAPALLHCGACSKCRERHDAFLQAGVPDPTEYAERVFVESGLTAHARRPR